MNNYLSEARISYVLDHLSHSIDITELKSDFVFLKNQEEVKDYKNKIIFLLSGQNINLNDIIIHNDIPVLFPVLKDNHELYFFENNNLIFNHDLLKSSFYLLSAFQELNPEYKGKFNRYPFELSVQRKLNITHKPVVNYYFDFIKTGIKVYCEKNKITYKDNKPFKPFGFFLTHDIDKVDTYTLNDLIYYIKLIFNFRNKNLSFNIKLKKIIEYTYNWIFTKKNPNWDFEFLRAIEEKYNFKSAFYFLPKDLKHQDAYYSFNEPRIIDLFNWLRNEECEIGIHGTNRSATDSNYLKSNISELEKHSKVKISGIRQHRLIFDINTTPYLHDNEGLKYDTTLGFAEHEGFRNSYCLPFRLYNFKEEKAFNTFEIPLNVMDVTLFYYRKLNTEKSLIAVKEIVSEIKKFNGIFTLLWHNGNFDKIQKHKTKEFYLNLLEYISNEHPVNILGENL